MRFAIFAMSGVMAGAFIFNSTSAEDFKTPLLRQPASVQKTSLGSDDYAYRLAGDAASPSPSDQPALIMPDAEKPVEQAPETTAGPCDCPNCCRCCDPSCGDPKPWTMPQLPLLQKLGIRTGGWIEQGINANGFGRNYGFNGPVFTDDINGEYQMNQLWLYFDRPVNTGGCGWDIGGHIDMIYGTDWRFGINHGLEDRINGFDRQSYGLVLPQFYVEVAYNNLSVKLGHMDDVMGYENVPSVLNPLYSHCYAFVFAEPILVTGAIAEYKLTEQFKLVAGFTRGWMQFEDYNGALDFLGGANWVSASKRLSLNYMVDTGPQDAAGIQDRFVHSFVLKYQVAKPLQYILQQNWGIEHNSTRGPQPGAQAMGDAEWYGILQYLIYNVNPRWSVIGRFEWFRDDDGVRVFGPPEQAGIRMWSGDPAAPGYAGDFYEFTAGVNWRPHPNFVFRPELRWDWYQGARNIAGQLPFNGGSADNQFLFGMDMIVTY